jgi:hypothetical protein
VGERLEREVLLAALEALNILRCDTERFCHSILREATRRPQRFDALSNDQDQVRGRGVTHVSTMR